MTSIEETALRAIHESAANNGSTVRIGVQEPQQALWSALQNLAWESVEIETECALFYGALDGKLWKVLVGPVDVVNEVW